MIFGKTKLLILLAAMFLSFNAFAQPTITIPDTDVKRCSGLTVGNLVYSGTTGAPVDYSIDFNGAAEAQGFVDVTNAALPFSPIPITIPAGATPATYSGSLTVRDAGLLVSAAVPITVTIHPTPTISNMPANLSVCPGQITAPINLISSPAGGTFAWTGGAAVGLANGSGNPSLGFTSSANNTGVNINSTVTVTTTVNGCISTGQTYTITNKPTPTISNMPGNLSVCPGQITSPINLISSPAGGTFAWTGGAAVGLANGSGNPSLGFTSSANNTGVNINSIVTVTTTVNGCISVGQTYTITNKPTPTVTTVNPAAICSGASLNLPLNASVPSTFTWSFTKETQISGPGAAGGGGSTITGVLNNSDNALSRTITYSVTATSVDGCPGPAKDIVVTVNPLPLVTNTNPAGICSGVSLNLPLTASVASSFAWTFTKEAQISGPGAAAGIGATIAGVLNNSDNAASHTITYNVIATVAGCPGPAKDIVVTVNPTPVIVPGTTTFCSGLFTGITATAPSQLTWTIGAVTPLSVIGQVSGYSGGSGQATIAQQITNIHPTDAAVIPYNVSLTSNAGCPGTPAVVNVTVNPGPALTLNNASIDTICSGGSISLLLNASIPGSYSWTVTPVAGTVTNAVGGTLPSTVTPITGILSNASTTNAASVKYSIVATANGNSCTGGQLDVIAVVNPLPTVNNATDSICSGNTPNITLGASVPSTFTWTSSSVNITGPGTTTTGGTAINAALTNTGNANEEVITYTVTPKSLQITPKNGGCTGTVKGIPVAVRPRPNVNAASSPDICSGGATNIILTSTTGIGSVFSWPTPGISGGILGASAGNNLTSINQTLSNPSNINGGSVTYTVTATSAKGCLGINTRQFTVNVNPSPRLQTVSKSASICSEGVLNHSLLSTVTGTSFTYSANTGNFNVKPTGNSGSLITDTIINNLDNDSVVVNYTVTLTTPANCAFNDNLLVTVHPKPTLNIVNNKTPICSGESTDIEMTASTGPGTVFTWPQPVLNGLAGPVPGSGNTLPFNIIQKIVNTSHSTQNSTNYIVTPTSAKSCVGNAVTFTVNVNPIPQMVKTRDTICSETIFKFTPTASTGSTTIFSYQPLPSGQFDVVTINTDTSNGKIHHRVSSNQTLVQTTKDIFYTISAAGCDTTQVFSLVVNPKPTVPLIDESIAPKEVCQNTILVNMSAMRKSNPNELFNWTASNSAKVNQDGNPFNRQNSLISFPNAGSTNVILTSFVNGFAQCANTGDTITVNVKPSSGTNPDVVLFNGNTLVCLANNVKQNTGVASYQWGFTQKSDLKDQLLAGEIRQDLKIVDNTTNPTRSLADTASRYYFVFISFNDGCTRKSYFKGPGVAIDDAIAGNAKMTVYPNPAYNRLSVDIEGVTLRDYDIEIYDLTGRLMKKVNAESNKTNIAIDDLAQGYYILSCKKDGVIVAITKFIKN